MKKSLFVSSFLLVAILASSCSNGSNYDNVYNKIISPTGAPTIVFYDESLSKNLTTNSVPSNVGAQLQDDNYGIVVFDFYNGLNSIKKNNADYKLARIITGGNLYLVGIGKSAEPTGDDYIVSFGENLLPDLVYRHIYSQEVVDATHYVSGVSDIGPILLTGLHNGNKVDYVVIAQPVLYSIVSQMDAETKASLNIVSLRDKWAEKTDLSPVIPQAGLFIHTKMYDAHKAYFDGFLDNLDDYILTCIESPEDMKNGLDNYGGVEEQKNLFGFTSTVAYNVQSNGQNGFALVDAELHDNLDIDSFLSELGIEYDYNDYIMF